MGHRPLAHRPRTAHGALAAGSVATATTAAPGDLASGLLPVPAWLIAAVALVVAGVGLAWLLHRRRKARRGPAR